MNNSGCKYCKDRVMILRKIDCESCEESEDGAMCGKLKRCPPIGEEYYYECVVDDENNYCPMCGRPLADTESEGDAK